MARVSKKKRPPREEKAFKEQKTIEESVFDQNVRHVVTTFVNKAVLQSVDYPIQEGKESVVFRATAGAKLGSGFVALKIYRIETSNFIHMADYIVNDPRFFGVKRRDREIVYAWTRKEFRNLQEFEKAGVLVPKAIAFDKNVLVLEFLGEEGIPDSTLQQVGSENPEKDCETLLSYVKKLFEHGFVHADLSEFNVIVHREELYLIDVGQGVPKTHPKFEEFLARDVQNILRYFKKYDVKKDEGKVLEWVKSSDKQKN